jgi:RNA polymerase sigma-70 factor (ECF subfamily)
MDELVAQTQLHRRALISYVYRLTGSMEDAKDITQETVLRLISAQDQDIKNAKAWMFKVATNLSLDLFKRIKKRREVYIGPWLPEPYIEESESFEHEHEIDESLSMALLVVMEKLGPKERVAYILHDLFEFHHKEVADILNTTPQNSRQITSRAMKKLQTNKKKYSPSKSEHLALTSSFINALKYGNFDALKELFSDDIIVHTDGGGRAIASRKILHRGCAFTSKLLIRVVSSLFGKNKDSELKTFWFNGSLGVMQIENGRVTTLYSLEVIDHKIVRIFTVRNPDKLERINKVLYDFKKEASSKPFFI